MTRLLALLLFVLPGAAGADALDEALGLVGLHRGNLGWRQRAHWRRYPGDIPYKLRHFDGLLADPMALPRFTRSFGRAAKMYLAPARLAKPGARGESALYKLVHDIGVSPRFGGFRSYSANLTATPTALDAAILAVHRTAGRPTRHFSFGQDSPYPRLPETLAARVKVVPEKARPILGRLILDVVSAHRWATLAFRRVPLETRAAVARRLDIGAEEVDALDYAPSFDDCAKDWDEASLWYAGLRCVDALERARRDLAALPAAPGFAFDWRTPLGWIRIRGGGDDVVDGHDSWLIVDLGGNDTYTGPVAASTPSKPIGLLLDLGGNDRYRSPDAPAQGAGICGVGVLLDAAGDDEYRAGTLAQGAGQFGLGALLDLGGTDRYHARFSAQGCGYFGVGVLVDAAGDDRYELHSDGQGFGGVAGVGSLADGGGDDVYVAVRDPKVTGRGSYHSKGGVAVSNAQGCAMGRRGDGADGHSWAGGLGLLLDVSGDDRYSSGNWSMGTGYWFGTGLLWDGAGNDAYEGKIWSQGSGAHFCIGALLDEGGDDAYSAERNALAFAHDFCVAMLIDLGKGKDTYAIPTGDGLSFSINRSVSMLIDDGGDDAYRGRPERRPGQAGYNRRMSDRSGSSTYFAEATSLALFLDLGGRDTYLGKGAADGSVWRDPKGSPNVAARNFGVGVDREGGELDLEPLPEKPLRRR